MGSSLDAHVKVRGQVSKTKRWSIYDRFTVQWYHKSSVLSSQSIRTRRRYEISTFANNSYFAVWLPLHAFEYAVGLVQTVMSARPNPLSPFRSALHGATFFPPNLPSVSLIDLCIRPSNLCIFISSRQINKPSRRQFIAAVNLPSPNFANTPALASLESNVLRGNEK